MKCIDCALSCVHMYVERVSDKESIRAHFNAANLRTPSAFFLKFCFKHFQLYFYGWGIYELFPRVNVTYEVVRQWSEWTQWSWTSHLSYQERHRVCCGSNCSGEEVQRRQDGIGECLVVDTYHSLFSKIGNH